MFGGKPGKTLEGRTYQISTQRHKTKPAKGFSENLYQILFHLRPFTFHNNDLSQVSFFFVKLKAVWNDQTFRTPQPLLLSWLVGLFEDETLYDRNAAYIAASGIVLLSFLSVIFFHHVNCGTLTTGMKIRVAVSSLLNRKVSINFVLLFFFRVLITNQKRVRTYQFCPKWLWNCCMLIWFVGQ